MNPADKLRVEIESSKAAMSYTDLRYHLGRAHVLSQNNPRKHLWIHWLMFKAAFRYKDAHEIRGQILRLIVTLPGHILGRVPKGNIGWSSVGLMEVMPIDKDLISHVEEYK
jgi:hypothetical protein